jgi:hypothetical protein
MNPSRSRFAIFVCANGQYLPFVNALLNSLESELIQVDVYLIHHEMPEAYIRAAQTRFSFPVYPVKVVPADFEIHECNRGNKNLFMKGVRFKYILQNGADYDAICLLDADMFIVSKNFIGLFEMVSGTRKMIGCNERHKWIVGPGYVMRNEPIFSEPTTLLKFHCSVPVLFDLKEWMEVVEMVDQMTFQAFEVCPDGGIKKPIDDMFCWNIAIQKLNRHNDVVLFPMETMTQVHYTAIYPWTRLQIRNGVWLTASGDEVFSIHGRLGTKEWGEGQIRGTEKLAQQLGQSPLNESQARSTLQAMERHWYRLNFEQSVPLAEFVPWNPYWDSIKP